MENKIKFAIVGCGNIGSRHLAVVDAEPRAEIDSICDIEIDKCRKFSNLYKDIPYYLDYTEMVKKTGADIINICTPHGLHADMTILAAEAGKNILVEKPMALTTVDALRMIDAAKTNNVKLMVVKQNRYNVPIALAKDVIESGKLGRIFMVQCNVIWNRRDEYYSSSNWRGKRNLEGGSLYTHVSHFIDLMIWWFGDIVNAKTWLDTKNHNIEVEDCGTALLRFANGVMGTLLWTTCAYNKNYEGSLTIIGEKGTIKVGGQYLNQIDYWDVLDNPLPDNVDFIDKPNIYDKYQGSSSNHDKVVNDVIASLLNERHNVVAGDEGIKTIEAIEMIYGSI